MEDRLLLLLPESNWTCVAERSFGPIGCGNGIHFDGIEAHDSLKET